MLPARAFALTATNVAFGNVRVGSTSAPQASTISRETSDQTLAQIDTSACTGVAVTLAGGATLPKTFTAADSTLGIDITLMPAARASYDCTITLRDGAATEIGSLQLTGTGVAPVLMVDTTDITFGEVKTPGNVTDTMTFVITNGTTDTGQNLTVSAIARSGTAMGDYTTSPATPLTITPGGSRTITVTFNPTADGTRDADLTVISDDPVDIDEVIAVTGTGVTPVIATMDTDFGVVTVGTEKLLDIAVSNSGTGTLTVMSAAISASGWFTFTTIPQASCNMTTSCNFSPDLQVRATPVNVRIRCAPPVGASGPPQTRTLTFTSDTTGGDGIVTLTCTAGRPEVSPSPATLAFGNVELGAMAAPQLLTVTNSGTEDLSISSATLVGTNATQYAMTMGQAGAQTVMPGQNTTWRLTCNPTIEGSLTGTFFRIASNAANSPTLDIPLSCFGGRLTSNQTMFDFGGVRVGDSATRTFTLRNDGDVTIGGFTAMFSAPADAAYTIESLPTTLAPGATDSVTVRFSPMAGTDGTQPGETHTFRIEGTYSGGQVARTRSMTLLGDGLTAGFVFDPTPLDLGPVRWDRTTVGSVAVRNPNEAPVRLTSVSLTPGTGTASSEITRVNSDGTPAGAFAAVDLLPGASITVYFKADPANRLGALQATFTVNSDLASSQMPSRQLPVRATSTSPAITGDPATFTYDFTAVDVDAGMVTKDLRLMNTGDGPLDVTSATIPGAGSPFSVVATPGTVAPGGMFTATVRYDPSVVRTDSGSLVLGVSGVFMGSMTATFTLAGRGIDRTFSVTDPGLFPETYRNPGSQAPVRDVIVRNTGEAPLRITATMIMGEPVWSLLNPEPVTIAGGQSAAFKVRFSPTSGGKAPTGSLVFSHDDDTKGNMATVELNGFGKNPTLSVSPAEVISLGTTAVGFPIRLSDTFPARLTVRNNDTKEFKVRELRLVGASGESSFSLSDDLTGTTLAPGEERNFDIVFAADTVGEITAQLQLFLDEDPEPATVVQLSGTAVEVDVQGGGGCQSASGSGALAALLVLVFAGLARRRSAKLAALAALALAWPRAGSAQTIERDLDLSLFRPQTATQGELMHVETPAIGQTGDWELGLAISYLQRPLEISDSMGETTSPVAQRTVFDFGGVFAIGGRFELGLRTALMTQSAEESQIAGLGGGEPSALGDLLVHGKVRLLGGAQGFALGFGSTITLPTATSASYAGPGKLTANGQLLASLGTRRLVATANLGFGYQDKITLGSMTQGNRFLFGAGASLRAADKLRVSAELFGAVGVGQEQTKAASPVEALLGVRYQLTRTLGLALGVGTGIVRGVGAPAMHGLVAFELAPNARALEPLTPPAPYVPPPDRDGDGLTDAEDNCAGEAEDKDGFADRDGCPDPDNDFDGVADLVDKCIMEREDRDGVDDADGCPDLDDDGDNISGTADKCPKDGEDKDGFADEDGCPDLDDDGDGLADADDKCPREPETINETDNQDGCPDSGPSALLVSAERLELMTPIQFVGQTAKLSPASITVLDQVAATLRATPTITRMRIGVHVHPRNDGDLALTERRAAVVRDWLLRWGIDAARIDARGFGSEKPVVSPRKRNAASANDRVELTILERK